ncbi:MAG: NAD-binding protein [Thermoplasmata archaeon]|nr:NAD-binding protein [Thermoplasmata archaeon]
MKVIIIGAGDVGFVCAETISDVHDVLVVEEDEDIADTLKGRLNVSVLREDGTNPRILRYAIETQNADVLVSTLHSDSDNLFVCMMAKRIKPSIRTVATVDSPDFMIETTGEGVPGVDDIISPNLVTAEKMYRLCVLENVVEYEALKQMGVCVAVFRVEGNHQIVGRVVMHLPIPKDCTIFAVYRDGDIITTPEILEIHSGDRICVFGSEQAIIAFNDLMGVEEVAREFCILGGSIVGLNLAKMLSEDERKRYVKIIERDPEVCKHLSRELSGVVVINADYTDPDIQYDENIFRVDSTISTSSRDETNLLICMSAKRHSARKVIARFFMREYEDIFRYTDLQTIIGFDRIISNEIIKCVLSDELAIARMQSSEGVFFTHIVDSESRLRNRFVGDANMPEGLRIVAIRRDGGLIYPLLDTEMRDGDAVIMFSDGRKESELIKVLGKGTTLGL